MASFVVNYLAVDNAGRGRVKQQITLAHRQNDFSFLSSGE